MQDQFQIAVCDDEQAQLERVQRMASEILSAEGIPFAVAGFAGGQALIDALHRGGGRFHVILTDVMMEGMDGMSLARELGLQSSPPDIILVSSNRDFALMGYEVKAVRFLAKPVERERLREALLYVHSQRIQRQEIVVRTAGGLRKLPVNRLRYAETRGRGSRLFLNGETVDTPSPIGDLEEELRSIGFFRCHQSFLIKLGAVELIRRYEVTLQGGDRIPVSKSRYNETRLALLRYASV